MRDSAKIKPYYIFLFFLVFYLLTFNIGGAYNYFYTADGKIEYEQMQSIVGGRFSLLISPGKHLGLSLWEAPFYLIGEALSRIFNVSLNPTFTLLMSNPVISSLLCLIVFLIIRILGKDDAEALIITLLCGFCTLIWPYSKYDVADSLLSLCLLSVFWALLNYNRSGQNKWFFIGLLLMGATYVTKLSGHGFLLGWLYFVYISGKKNNFPLKDTIIKILLVILVWLLCIPLSMSVNRAHSQCYTWSWFQNFGYKILIREFSLIDGLFWYNSLLVLVFFSVKDFIKEHFHEFIFILLLFTPYFVVLHLGKDVVCIYEYANRYDMVYVPLLLVLLLPLIRKFHNFSILKRLFFIAIIVWSFYVQLLGSSVSILYYANIIGCCLGEWQKYLFSLKFSPFVVYPRLILQGLTGLAVYTKSLNNVSGSIDYPFKLDYFWYGSDSMILKLVALVLLLILLYLGRFIFYQSGINSMIKKYFKELIIVIFGFLALWIVAFVPKEIFTKRKKIIVPVNNSSFEIIVNNKENEKIPLDWRLIDWSRSGNQPSVLFDSSNIHIDGNFSLEIMMNQEYVTISLVSQPFEVSEKEIIQASCFIKSEKSFPATVRISFSDNADVPFYYAPTTKVYQLNNGWKKFFSKVLVPEGAKKAYLLVNVWGGVKKGSSIYVDNVNIVKWQ